MMDLHAFDAVVQPWIYHQSIHGAVEWWIAACAFYGGILFMIGGFSGSSPYLTHDSKAGLPNTYNALVYVTFCIGSYLFTLGCFLMTVPVVNEGYLDRCLIWKLQSSHLRVPPPTYRWLGFKPCSISYWGGVVYTCGAVLYNIGTTVGLADQFASVSISDSMQVLLEQATFLVGGVGFLLGGASYVVESKGRSSLQGILIPRNAREWLDLDYWINWLNFWGGAGFFMSGIFLMFPTLPIEAYRIENAIGFGLGSTCFTLGGLLLFVKMSLARRRAEDEEYDHVRGDSFGSIALSTISEQSPR